MEMYFLIILISMTLISVFNIIFDTAVWYCVILSVIWCTALQFLFDLVIAACTHIMPQRWFKIENKFYRVSKFELDLYKKLGVRKWKDKVWELGGIGGFSKKTLAEPNNPLYVERFIIECNKGVLTHRISYFVGFLAMFTLPGVCRFTIALPIALVNLFLNILPTIILRYNTPKLKVLLIRLNRIEVFK